MSHHKEKLIVLFPLWIAFAFVLYYYITLSVSNSWAKNVLKNFNSSRQSLEFAKSWLLYIALQHCGDFYWTCGSCPWQEDWMIGRYSSYSGDLIASLIWGVYDFWGCAKVGRQTLPCLKRFCTMHKYIRSKMNSITIICDVQWVYMLPFKRSKIFRRITFPYRNNNEYTMCIDKSKELRCCTLDSLTCLSFDIKITYGMM